MNCVMKGKKITSLMNLKLFTPKIQNVKVLLRFHILLVFNISKAFDISKQQIGFQKDYTIYIIHIYLLFIHS